MIPHDIPPLLCLAGPTAAGKSALALLLADQLGGEIVSVDSMQVYRGMDIGTAKPSAAERRRVPHHLIDLVNVDHPFDAAQFVEHATRAVQDVCGRGRLPILCGGTGLYFNSLFFGLSSTPRPDPELRRLLEGTPLPELLAELAARDPATYARIDRSNPRRVVRAVEVVRLTDQPYSGLRQGWPIPGRDPGAIAPHLLVAIRRHSADLRNRIDLRVDAMFRDGLVGETERLLSVGLATNRTAKQALGYRQAMDYLDGQCSLPQAIAEVKHRTWQLARRQLTWFKRQLSCDWIDWEPGSMAESLAADIRSRYTARLKQRQGDR